VSDTGTNIEEITWKILYFHPNLNQKIRSIKLDVFPNSAVNSTAHLISKSTRPNQERIVAHLLLTVKGLQESKPKTLGNI